MESADHEDEFPAAKKLKDVLSQDHVSLLHESSQTTFKDSEDSDGDSDLVSMSDNESQDQDVSLP